MPDSPTNDRPPMAIPPTNAASPGLATTSSLDPDQARSTLLGLLAERAYRHGSFTLASGRTSDHYVNCKPVSLSGPGLALLGRLMLKLVEEQAIAVAAPTSPSPAAAHVRPSMIGK